MNSSSNLKASESFIQSLKELDSVLKLRLRVVKSGVFIPEDQVSKISSSYTDWLTKNNISLKSDDKIHLRIFSVESPKMYYLPEGNICLSGFLSPFEGSLLEELGIKKTVLSLIDATTYIHPKDNFLSEYKNFRVKSSPQTGTTYELISNESNLKSEVFIFSDASFKTTLKLIKESKKFSTQYPELNISMRDGIPCIVKLLSNSRLISKNKKFFVPERFKAESYNFRLISNLVFVTNAKNEVVFTYELRGKNFLELIDLELAYIRNNLNKKYLDVFEVFSNSKEISGLVKIKREVISIDKRAFNELVQNATVSRWLKSKLQDRFTLSEIILAISSALKYADWVDVSKLGENPNMKSKPRLELKYTPWTFVTISSRVPSRNNNKNKSSATRTKIIRFIEGSSGIRRKIS